MDTSAWDTAAQTLLTSPAADGATALYVAVHKPSTGWIYKAYGDASQGVPATLDDRFPIGSITKTALATAVLQHVGKGDLSLNDTVKKLDPKLAARFPSTARWTVRQLLSMSTTIPDYAEAALDQLVANPRKTFARDQLIRIGLTKGKKPPAGGAYSTTNYIILGDLMRAVTGKSPTALVNDIYRQAKLTHSRLTTLGVRPAPMTHGYVGTAQASAPTRSTRP